jgi:glycosyltransferase involved in cell wall biosynthesis
MNAVVSAILAVRNGSRYLPHALESVLGQTRPPDEVIVVDDGSDDGSDEVARGFPAVTCLRIDRSGQGAALNRGVAASRGTHLAFLDADDEWLTEKLELQLACFESDRTLDAVFGHVEQVVETGDGTARSQGPSIARLPGAMLITRAALLRCGPFAAELRLGMVVEWYARAKDAGLREVVLPDVVYRRRIHGDNMGIRHAAERAEYAVMLKKVLDRRRARRDV